MRSHVSMSVVLSCSAWLGSVYPADAAVTTVCQPTEPKRLPKVLRTCSTNPTSNERSCAVYKPIRSNLCEAKRLQSNIKINYELFGRNDCRAQAAARRLSDITHVVIHQGGWDAEHN